MGAPLAVWFASWPGATDKCWLMEIALNVVTDAEKASVVGKEWYSLLSFLMTGHVATSPVDF